MSKKQVILSGFFIVLVFAFYFGLTKAIPEFGRPKVPPIGTVQPFAFLNQDSNYVTEKDLKGKIAVVNFFFTTCNTVCPKMNNNLKSVYDQVKNEPGVVLYSFTSDPKRDSVAQLKRYADSLGVDGKKWVFLTGRKDSLYSAARHSFRLDDPQNYVTNIDDDFLHTQFIALVNRKGEVVHIYDGIKPSEVNEMQERIKTLLKE